MKISLNENFAVILIWAKLHFAVQANYKFLGILISRLEQKYGFRGL